MVKCFLSVLKGLYITLKAFEFLHPTVMLKTDKLRSV